MQNAHLPYNTQQMSPRFSSSLHTHILQLAIARLPSTIIQTNTKSTSNDCLMACSKKLLALFISLLITTNRIFAKHQ